MMRALYTAASGMSGQQFNIDTIANNLANVNTAGFKKSRADFQDLLYQSIRFAGTPVTAGAQIPTGIEVGHGVRPVATQKIFTHGTPRPTENPLDLAIEGDGFFQVLLPDGTVAYTRDGAFKKDGEGRIVTSDGFLLEPEIVIPEDAVEVAVGADGTVSVKLAGRTSRRPSARSSWRASSTPPGSRASAATSTWPRPLRECPSWARPAWKDSGPSPRASWRCPTCRWSRKWWP